MSNLKRAVGAAVARYFSANPRIRIMVQDGVVVGYGETNQTPWEDAKRPQFSLSCRDGIYAATWGSLSFAAYSLSDLVYQINHSGYLEARICNVRDEGQYRPPVLP